MQSDINHAMEYYFIEASEKVAHQFWEELSENLIYIRRNPTVCHIDKFSKLRRKNLKAFPYNILFEDYPGFVRVQVIRHNERRETFGT
ncbi:MAG: hypothetical protein AAF226_13420, partial [Verrucomicrobiota bacterium]